LKTSGASRNAASSTRRSCSRTIACDRVRELFDAYRESYVDNGVPGCGGLAYMPLVFTGDSDDEARRGAEELFWYVTNSKSSPQFGNPPGYAPVSANVKFLRTGYSGPPLRRLGLDALMEHGVIIAGTPDTVAAQIKRYYDRVGGFDHFLMMQQAGRLDHERTVRSMSLFAREVYPQIKDLPSTIPGRTPVPA
jgi:alkanesulfonate monooxygenase SsuD/methylene tetrahydromethanopterin reductase-like flavin-dependent oxidoreductase (luciferase family)